MIDPILSLAFSTHSNKGVYALLLGSGVSRAAGVPTGWEIVLDLVRKLAHLRGEDCEPDPAAWYKNAFGEESDYAKLLDAITKSPSERNQLLRSYFEPSEEEREQGLKVPTAAHRAIADLIASGHVRVIVTTNFDRLPEKALEEVGVVPTVISTPDAVDGALPLTHTRCSIIKVHGDYLDTRVKNTPAELEQYDKRLNRLLDRIFDEFGLIVCGWSAEWDTALRAALERCRGHRFTTFWAVRGEPQGAAKRLIELRRAEVIRIRDADSFFQELAEKVSALQEVARPHPLSAKVAVASLKKYLVDDRYKIRLHDLLTQEVEKLYGELSDEHFPVQGVSFTADELRKRVQHYEALTEIVLAIMVTGCYWGEESHEYLWTECLERIANPPGERSGFDVWLNLRLYPALLLLYGGGLISIAAGRYSTFSALLTKARVRNRGQDQPLVRALYPGKVMEKEVGQELLGMNRYTPLSDHLYEVLREPLREFLPDDFYYQRVFDRFEYLFALVYWDLRGGRWAPIGCFGWRDWPSVETTIMKEIELEVSNAAEHWPPLQAGLFGVSVERFQSVKAELDKFIEQLGWSW